MSSLIYRSRRRDMKNIFGWTKPARLIADIFLRVDRELHMLFPALKSQKHQKEVVTRA